MFTIQIDDGSDKVPVSIYDIDDNLSIVSKYIVSLTKQKKHGLYHIPGFFRLHTEGNIYKITDIRTVLMNMDIVEVAFKIPTLLDTFDILNAKSIFLTWFITKKYGSMSLLELEIEYNRLSSQKGVLRPYFPNVSILFEGLSSYSKECVFQYNRTVKIVDTSRPIYQSLYAVKTSNINIQQFEPESIVEIVHVSLPNNESIYEIFDRLMVSKNIPFVCMGNIYKLYDVIDEKELREWLNADEPTSIYIRVLSENEYIQCIWRIDNSIYVYNKGTIDRIIGALDNVKVKVSSVKTEDIKGKFSMRNIRFNKGVMADLISTNNVFSYFLFFNEFRAFKNESDGEKGGYKSTKTVVDKKRFVAYYKNPYASNERPFTITMTNVYIDDRPNIDVRIAYAKTQSQVDQFIKVCIRLFNMYFALKSSVEKEYIAMYPNINFKKFEEKPPKDIKPNKRTGTRLRRLQKAKPDVFGKGDYSKKCQELKQPYIVDPNKINDVRRLFEESDIPDLAEHGFLEWEGDTYACYPREKSDTRQDYVYPGLHRNALKPCCFVNDQAVKKSKKPKHHENVIDGKDEYITPLGLDKKELPRGRLAKIPYFIQIVADSVKHDKIYRYGVLKNNASFVECLQKVYDTSYSDMTVVQKRENTAKILNELINSTDDYLVVCRGIFRTYDRIREGLSSQSYIDPNKYMYIFEKKYRCNIIVLEMSDTFPKGEISPLLSVPYTERDTVVILKVCLSDDVFQCDLIVEYTEGKFRYKFSETHPFIIAIREIASKKRKTYTF